MGFSLLVRLSSILLGRSLGGEPGVEVGDEVEADEEEAKKPDSKRTEHPSAVNVLRYGENEGIGPEKRHKILAAQEKRDQADQVEQAQRAPGELAQTAVQPGRKGRDKNCDE